MRNQIHLHYSAIAVLYAVIGEQQQRAKIYFLACS